MFMYKIACNRIFRLVTVLLMIFVFMLVPTENRLQDAKTAYAVAIADDAVIVIVIGILISMGVWNAYKVMMSLDYEPFDNGALRALAKKCIDNIPELYQWGLTVASGIDVKALINVPKAIYKLIKDYLETEYADEGVAEGMSKDSDLVSAVNGATLINGKVCYPLADDGTLYGTDLVTYPFFCNPSETYRFSAGNPSCLDKEKDVWESTIYQTQVSNGVVTNRGSIRHLGMVLDISVNYYYKVETFSTASDGRHRVSTGCYCTYASSSGSSYMRLGEDVTYLLDGEYEMFVAAVTGLTGLSLDQDVFNSEYAPYIKAYTDIANYLDATAADITSINAKLDGLASNVVNTSAQSIHWTGGITDCPIDDLKSQLEDLVTSAPAIGDWTCSWDKSGTLCDISVTDISTGEKVADISGDVAISWTDVATEIGVSTDSKADTDVDTDSKVDTDTKTDTGELTMPDDSSKIDWKPLQLAGELFTTRFPFSLPWDLYRSFTMFEVGSGKAPVISLPINLGEYGDYSVDIDLTVFDDNVVIVVRWTTYVGFLFALVILTNKLIGRG